MYGMTTPDCVWQCKNNKKEANHNGNTIDCNTKFIVFDSAKIIKKKQITTRGEQYNEC